VVGSWEHGNEPLDSRISFSVRTLFFEPIKKQNMFLCVTVRREESIRAKIKLILKVAQQILICIGYFVDETCKRQSSRVLAVGILYYGKNAIIRT
jgi:hypothetical protein